MSSFSDQNPKSSNWRRHLAGFLGETDLDADILSSSISNLGKPQPSSYAAYVAAEMERLYVIVEHLKNDSGKGRRVWWLQELESVLANLERKTDFQLLPNQRKDSGWSVAVRGSEVVKVAVSRVEGYSVVAVVLRADVRVQASVAPDLVLIVSELVDNALLHADSRVGPKVELTWGQDEYLISVVDHGAEISEAKLERLQTAVNAGVQDSVSDGRAKGLSAIGYLAAEQGLKLELASGVSGGLIATIAIPGTLLEGGLDAQKSATERAVATVVVSEPRQSLTVVDPHPEKMAIGAEPAATLVEALEINQIEDWLALNGELAESSVENLDLTQREPGAGYKPERVEIPGTRPLKGQVFSQDPNAVARRLRQFQQGISRKRKE